MADNGNSVLDGLYALAKSFPDKKNRAKAYILGIIGNVATWANITGKPVKFPPENHTHLLADITDYTSSTSTGDMIAAVYDPAGIADDAFDYDNFINTPTIPTDLSDLTDSTSLIPTSVDDLAPSQATNSGKVLTTNGTNASWGTISSALDFVNPDWLPNIRHWVAPDSLYFSVTGSSSYILYWYNKTNRGNYYYASSYFGYTIYKGQFVPDFVGSGNKYFLSDTGGQYSLINNKVYFGPGATGSYTWMALLKADATTLTATDVIEQQYRDLQNPYHVIIIVIVDVGGTLYLRVYLRDVSGNLVTCDAPASEISDWTLVCFTYNNSTQTINLYMGRTGNSYTATNTSVNFATSVTTVNSGKASIGCGLNTSNTANANSIFCGNIAERVLYTDVKDSATINKLAKYFTNKYADTALWTDI